MTWTNRKPSTTQWMQPIRLQEDAEKSVLTMKLDTQLLLFIAAEMHDNARWWTPLLHIQRKSESLGWTGAPEFHKIKTTGDFQNGQKMRVWRGLVLLDPLEMPLFVVILAFYLYSCNLSQEWFRLR
ncbi:hypothetical protein BJ165DRAFT_1409180 [Panaeolus papilionaceus]|nr:hypothetical protein BJ165DRAFT_1409180 [Panaeolus papilionaceus]